MLVSMITNEIESAVLSLPSSEQLRIADQIWDRIEAETEDDAEIISELRKRINSQEMDGPSVLQNPQRWLTFYSSLFIKRQ
jgi:hypothetical protein